MFWVGSSPNVLVRLLGGRVGRGPSGRAKEEHPESTPDEDGIGIQTEGGSTKTRPIHP